MEKIITAGRKIMGQLGKGDDLLTALGKCCEDMGIKLGEVRAIGAESMARVGYYDQVDRKYLSNDRKETNRDFIPERKHFFIRMTNLSCMLM